MRTLPTSFNHNQMARGFTLLELMLVAALIGLLASVTAIGIGNLNNDLRDLRQIAKRFELQLEALIGTSVLEGRSRALALDEEFFYTYELDHESANEIPYKVTSKTTIPDYLVVEYETGSERAELPGLLTEAWVEKLESTRPIGEQISSNGEEEDPEPDLLVLPGGTVEPFSLRIAFKGQPKPEIFLRVNEFGEVSLREVADE